MRAAKTLGFIAALFAAGLVRNVAVGKATLGNSLASLLIVALCLAAGLFVQREAQLREAFLAYLRNDVDVIRAGRGSFRGQPVTYATELRVYTIVLSFLVVSVKQPTRFVIRREASDRGLRVGCSVVSVVFGWWGIPWGPIWTAQALFTNLRGATVTTVGALIEGAATAAPPAATARA